jgi:uncharacterized protein (DUF433 family)
MTSSAVVRTKRGWVIPGTRITLYQVLDHLDAGWSPKLLGTRLNLSTEIVENVMAWIHEHRASLEEEHRSVSEQATRNKAYWETRNQDKLNRLGKLDASGLRQKIIARNGAKTA